MGGPEGGTYACTAVTDTWLDLLQLAFCAMRRLPRAMPDLASSRRVTAELDSKPSNAAAGSRRATAELDVRLGNALASYSGALQDLLRQLLQHWKVQPSVQGLPPISMTRADAALAWTSVVKALPHAWQLHF